MVIVVSALIFLIIRLVSRFQMRNGFETDDWIMLVAGVSAIILPCYGMIQVYSCLLKCSSAQVFFLGFIAAGEPC
jgi:hypothetical protein